MLRDAKIICILLTAHGRRREWNITRLSLTSAHRQERKVTCACDADCAITDSDL